MGLNMWARNGIPPTVYWRVPVGFALAPLGWTMVVVDTPVGGVVAEWQNALISAPVSSMANLWLAVKAVCAANVVGIVVTFNVL
jgi:hypothetical protein